MVSIWKSSSLKVSNLQVASTESNLEFEQSDVLSLPNSQNVVLALDLSAVGCLTSLNPRCCRLLRDGLMEWRFVVGGFLLLLSGFALLATIVEGHLWSS